MTERLFRISVYKIVHWMTAGEETEMIYCVRASKFFISGVF